MKSMNPDGPKKYKNSKMPNMITPNEFFLKVFEQYKKAAEVAGGPYYHWLKIGGKIIKLTFDTNTLLSMITPAFDHLTIPPAIKADLEVFLWDSVSTDTAMVHRPWNDDAFLPRGEVKGFSNDQIKTVYLPDRDALSILDLQNNKAVYWVKDANTIPYFESGTPLLGILPQWFLSKGIIFVHGGAVGIQEGGVLIVGQGGSGKSSTALQCLKSSSSLYYAADDYCLLELDPLVKVHSVFCSGKLDPDQIDNLSFLKTVLYNSSHLQSEKALFFLAPRFSDRLIQDFPLKAILIPRIIGKGKTYFQSASAVEGLRALAPSTIFQLSGFNREAFSIMSALVQRVPSYHLYLGENREETSYVIKSLLKQLT